MEKRSHLHQRVMGKMSVSRVLLILGTIQICIVPALCVKKVKDTVEKKDLEAFNEFQEHDFPAPDTDLIRSGISNTRSVMKLIDNNTEDEATLATHYHNMLGIVIDLVNLTSNPNNAVAFNKLNGPVNVIYPNLLRPYPSLKEKLLELFEKVLQRDNKSRYIVPMYIIDKVLDIFEFDDDMKLKKLALAVLATWAPGNPKLQARVMKLRGLDMFYAQLDDLNTDVIRDLIYLFYYLVSEHLGIKEKTIPSTPAEQSMFQMIGFLEKISSKNGCKGILKLSTKCWSHTTTENRDMFVPIVQIMNLTKPFCAKHLKEFKASQETNKMLKSILNFLHEIRDKPAKHNHVRRVNVPTFEDAILKYMDELKPVRQEL